MALGLADSDLSSRQVGSSCTTFRETSWESWPSDRIYTLFLSISSEGRVGKCIVSTWENCHGFLFPKATSPNSLPPSCVASPHCTHWWHLNAQSHSDCQATGTKMWQWLKGVVWTLEALPCCLWCLRDDLICGKYQQLDVGDTLTAV